MDEPQIAPTGRMKGRRVLVTGAGTGIGRGVALELAREGAEVVLHYQHSREGAESAVEEIVGAGGRALALAADFRDAGAASALPARAAEYLGGLDVLVNNARITMNQPFLDTTVEQFDTLFDVNIRAMFFATQGAARIMVRQGKGAVVNVSSVHAYGAMTEHSVYAATKTAITGFTRTLSVELIQKNIRVNCVASGWVFVENQRKLASPDFDEVAAGAILPSGFIGKGRDIGRLVIFLASDESRYIIGQTILCDGGQTTVLPCTPSFRTPGETRYGQGYVPGSLAVATGRERFLRALRREGEPGNTCYGTGTSVVCQDLMRAVGTGFPAGHTDPEAMFRLALAGHTQLGLDVVMPLFSVCHEAAAMGCRVDWGGPDRMPESGKPIYETSDDIRVPPDLLSRPACSVPLQAIARLKRELGRSAAVCGKVFGGWTQGYHYFGLESFLIKTITEPNEVKRIIDRLLPVTVAFARAQIDAGADCILLADHATRDLCGPAAYDGYLREVHARLVAGIPAPIILHICGDTSDRIGMIERTGVACFHWDTKTGSPAKVRELAGDRMALMGGISNQRLLLGTPEEIPEAARAAAAAGIDVVGPECAIPLTTPLPNLMALTGKETS